MSRASRLSAQIALLLALVSTSAFVVLRPYLTDRENLFENGRINEVVTNGGPMTIGDVEWKLDSLKAYTTLIDDEGEEIDLGGPAGSLIMVATLTVTPREGLYLKNHGFSCKADLMDDRGNIWEGQQAYGYPIPTSCTDEDHPFAIDKPSQIAQVYVVPGSAVPHLTGVLVEKFDDYRRVLITP